MMSEPVDIRQATHRIGSSSAKAPYWENTSVTFSTVIPRGSLQRQAGMTSILDHIDPQRRWHYLQANTRNCSLDAVCVSVISLLGEDLMDRGCCGYSSRYGTSRSPVKGEAKHPGADNGLVQRREKGFGWFMNPLGSCTILGLSFAGMHP